MSPHATFRLWGPDLDPIGVTAALHISPSYAHARGQPRGRNPTQTWPHGMWHLSSEHHIESDDLELHIAWVLDRIEPLASSIEEFRRHDGMHADLFCYWEGTGNDGIEFSPTLLGRIAALDLQLGIDIAFAADDEDTEN